MVYNEAKIKALKWTKDQCIGLGDELYLNLRRSSKTYIIRKQMGGKIQIISPGKSPAMTFEYKYPMLYCAKPESPPVLLD